MKTALITGVNGQDGSFLSEFLLEEGYTVVGLQRHPITQKYNFNDDYFKNIVHLIDNERFLLEYGDMLDPTSLWKAINKYKPDEVYNLAAQSHVNLSFDSSEITSQVNALGVLHLLNILVELTPKVKFFQASSGDMYGENPLLMLNEECEFKPNTPYGVSKFFAHQMVDIYRKRYHLFGACGICFNHESSRRGDNFATQKIALGAAKIKMGLQEKLSLGNLDIKRDWGHARDYVKAMWLMLQQDRPEDYVISTGKGNSLRSFAEIIFGYANLDMNEVIDINPNFYRSYEKLEVIGDSEKIKSDLGWTYETTFNELAIEMYESGIKSLRP